MLFSLTLNLSSLIIPAYATNLHYYFQVDRLDFLKSLINKADCFNLHFASSLELKLKLPELRNFSFGEKTQFPTILFFIWIVSCGFLTDFLKVHAIINFFQPQVKLSYEKLTAKKMRKLFKIPDLYFSNKYLRNYNIKAATNIRRKYIIKENELSSYYKKEIYNLSVCTFGQQWR